MAADMAAQPRSDELLNQSPPYVDVDLYAQRPTAARAPLRVTAARATRPRSPPSAGIGAAPTCSSSARAGQREPAEAENTRRQGLSPRFHRVSSGLSRAHGRERRRRSAGVDLARRRDTGGRAGARSTRAARFYMAAQVETGHLCPITMTRAAVAALAVEPPLRRQADAEDRVAALRSDVSVRGGRRPASRSAWA